MSAVMAAVIRLAPDVDRPRCGGWRCTCAFEEIVSSDGERLVGVEITPSADTEILPGVETEVTLRLWAPLSQVPQPHTTVHFYEGGRLVASGIVGRVVETDGPTSRGSTSRS